jgi:hypothetical protein
VSRKLVAYLRKARLRLHINKIMREDKELFDRLGSDYENGIPYWDKKDNK